MVYALVHYPIIDARRIDELRRKYDPQVDLIAPHITIVFPLPDQIDESDLVSHIRNVLHDWEQFPIHLRGLAQSWDNHLFLLVEEGNAGIIRLHDELYTGLLTSYHRKDLAYVPHVTLGSFADDADGCSRALRETEQFTLQYWCVVDRLSLVKVNEDGARIIRSKDFRLKA
jgi:2'-5' RNA ligase